MAKLKISKTPTGTTGPNGAQRTDQHTGSEQITSGGITSYPGSVGGIYTQSGAQIHAQANTGNGATNASLLRAKGEHKFLCTDGTTQKICTLVNSMVPDGGAGQVSVPVYTGYTYWANVTAQGSATTSTYMTYSTVAANTAPSGTAGFVVGAKVMGTGINGNVTITAINPATTINGVVYGNVTLGFTSQTVTTAAANSGTPMQVGFFASKLTNRWVWDWGNDGNGYRNKYRFWSQSPTTANPYLTDKAAGTTGFVQIPDAV
jgi:hypothetical protein